MRTITITVTDEEEAILANDVTDFAQWLVDAKDGKVNSCKKRLIAGWVPKLMADPTVDAIPAKESELIAAIVNRPDYKTRAARDAIAQQ